MRYECMLPGQIRHAIEHHWPVVLPLGVLEYHGEHLAVGLDTLVVVKCVERLERQIDMVVLPPFYYGAASYAVKGPEGSGSVQVEADVLAPFAYSLFQGLLRIGFRNIHGIIHHQTENFVAGMPTDLAFKLAARRATFALLQDQFGDGWWGSQNMANYYEGHAVGDNPFNWVQVHPLMDQAIINQYSFDHAGVGETSLLMALMPECVQMDKLDTSEWYLKTAAQATPEYGQKAVDLILPRLRRILAPHTEKH
jgi:creatinine amidohydrolase